MIPTGRASLTALLYVLRNECFGVLFKNIIDIVKDAIDIANFRIKLFGLGVLGVFIVSGMVLLLLHQSQPYLATYSGEPGK